MSEKLSYEIVSRETLADFVVDMELALLEAEQGPDAALSEGKWCRWCPAQHKCPLKNGTATKAVAKFVEPGPVEYALEDAMELVERLEPWIKNVKDEAHARLERGEAVNGYKLVPKRATRKWNDATALSKRLRGRKIRVMDTHEAPVVKSPAQLEKVLKKLGKNDDFLAEYIISVSSGNTMAKDGDKRDAIVAGPSVAKRLAAAKLKIEEKDQ